MTRVKTNPVQSNYQFLPYMKTIFLNPHKFRPKPRLTLPESSNPPLPGAQTCYSDVNLLRRGVNQNKSVGCDSFAPLLVKVAT